MKNVILGLGILLGASSWATEKDNGVNPVTTTQKFHGWISDNVTYPENALENKEQGTVYISFTIAESGTIENVSVAQGATTSLNMAALDVVMKMPVSELLSGSEKYGTTYIVPIKFVIK